MFEDPRLEAKPKPWVIPQESEEPRFFINKPVKKKTEDSYGSTMVPGFEKESYEKQLPYSSISPYTRDLDYERAISQSTGSQLANGVGRIVLNTLPGIVSNFASMLDVEDYFNQDAEVGNAITNAVDEWKQGVSEALPIYRENPGKSFDLGDSGWWIENGSSLVGSIAEFAATGAGLGALLGGLSKMGQAGELAATLLSAIGLNQAESIQDATSTYKTIFEREVLKGSSPYIAAEKAAQAASTVINIDRANILLNLTSANLFMKRPVGTRLKLDAPSITRDVKRAGMEGLQEYAEETVNYIAQEEGLDEDEQLTFDEILDRVSSLEGIEAGVLGFIGGMGQTGGTAIANRLTGKTKEEQERYLNQVKEIDDINNMLKEQNLSTISDVLMDQSQIADLNKEIREAEASEDKDLKDKTYNKVLGFREYKSFVNGTTEDLINVFEKIKSLSPEDAAKKGLDTDEKSENYYTNLAEKAIKQIKRDENIYNTLNLSQYYNGAEILQNRSEYHDLQKKIDDIDNSINKIKNVLPEEELHKSKTEPFENLKEGYIVRQKSLTKEFQQITSKEHQKKLAEEYQKKANLIKETSKEIKKNIVKSNPSKLNEVLESTLEPDEINELKQTAATASKKERIGSDSALFPEVKPEIKPTKKKFVLEDKEARESLLKETKESNEKTVENEKLGIDNYINSKKGRPTFSKDVERKRNAILAKKFPKEVEDTLLQYIDDSHYSETGLRLSPVTDELKNEINTKKKTSKGKQTFDRTEESDIINKTIDSTITNTTEYKDPGLLTIAFRGKEEDGTINPRYFPLINPNLFNAGTKITLRVNDNPDTIVDFKTKQTWGQLKSQIKSESEIADRIPIEVVYEGNVIAYLHDSTWKPEKTKDTTNLDIQRKELSSLRNHVYSNGEIETTVERKSAGVLEKTSESRTLSELPNDSNMLFHVSTIKGLTNLKDTFVYNDPNFVGKNIGHTFISVVVGKENGQNRRLLYDTTNARLGENKELSDTVYETIETAVTIYHKNKLKLLDELDRKIIKDIEDSTGLRIINYGDLHKYLSQFIQLADLGKKQTLEDISELYDNDLHLLALNPNGFEVLVRENDSQSFSFIQLGEKKGWTVKTMNLLKDNIDNYFTHVSKNAIEDNKPLVLINRGKVTTMYNTYTDYLKATLKTNLNPVEISEGVVAYTLQNRIFISNPVKTAEVKKDISKDELKKRKDEITEIVNTILKDKDPKSLQSIEEGITEIEEKLAIPSSMIDYVENQLLEKFQEYDATIVKKQILSTFLDPTVIKSLDVKETTKPIEVKKKTDIEKQKSDIERRRQEELDNQAGNIRVKTEVVEGINDNDEPTRILIHTNKDGSRTVQFEGKFNGEKDWTRIGTEKVSADTPLEARGYANRTYGIQKPRVVEIIENPKSLPADKINAKYDAELKVLEGKESTRVEEVKDEVSDENQKKVDELLKKFHFGNNEKDDDVNYDFEIGTDLSEVEKNVKSFLIKEMGSRRQQDFINYLTSLVIRKVSKTAKSDKPIKVSLKDISDGLFFKLKEDVDNANEILKLDPNQPEALRVIAVNKTINDNREFLENMAYYSLQKVGIIKIKNDADLESDEDLLGGDETQNEKTKFDQHSAEVDTKNKVSRELKLFMSGIHEFKKDKTIARNFLNRRKFMDWETVFNDLQNLTANVLPDFDYIINRLKGYVDSRPYLNEVINRLEKSPRNIQNQFVEIMSNHANHMELVLIDKRGKKYTYIIQKSNLNDVATRLSEYWSANFFDSKLVTTNVDGEFKYDSKVLNELTSEYTSWKNPTISQVSAWLEKIGIVLSEQSWKAIQEGEYVDRKTKYNLDTFVTKGTIKFIYDRLAGVTSSTVITPEDNLLKDQSVEELSKFDSRFTMTMLSNSHRAGNKQVYTFNQNKFLVNNFIDLKNLTDHGNGIFTSKLLTEKAKGIFSSRSWWLHKMVEHESNGEIKYYNGEVVVNPNGLFFSNFDYTTSDLEAMKEFGKPSEDNREMVKLSPMEVEVTKIGRIQSTNFVNRSNEKFSKGEKIGEVSYLTTSDKPTPMMIRTILPDLKLDIDGNPTEETYKFLLDQLVMPEIDRMFLFKKHKDQGVDYNNKEYEAGAKYFLIIPELNKIEGIFDKNGFISDGVDSADDPTLMNKIKEELKKHIESLIKEKKEKWTNWKIGETFNWPNGEIKVQDAFLDANFADKYLKSTDKLNAAVTHYVLNNLVSNVNIAMLFATDPANYFVEDSRKSLDNNIRDTFTNLGKRLAADAGPKTSNQDSLTSSSIEAVVDDLELDSLFFNEYLMKLDGITKEQWDNMSKSERKKLNSYQYSQIKGTDAQEFMTVKEHLRDLDSRGRLNPILYPNAARLIDEEIEKGNHYYNKIVHDKLEEIEEGLGEEYNKIILTPVKPQYTYNIFDPNLRVEKRVFIKSSAYPLSDNFTKNKELDRLRIAMESQAIDRLAFKSAVKTGAPKTSTKLWTNGVMKYSPSRALWNEYDSLRLVKDKTEEQKKRFEELDANYIFFNDSNTLVLPRRGYGIQQETPFDPLKEHINRVTQAHKNIFVDLLDVDGFEYNGEKLVGRDLAKIYNEKFKSLFKYLYDDLKTELGLDDDLKVTPNLIDKVKEVIRKEMMERNYALSDIEFLQLENSLNMIAYLPSSSKIEALLNSIVKNRILKMKFPGYSFILGSEEGYQIIDDFYRYKGSIVFTDKFKGTLGKNQIIIPFRYTDKEGNLLDLQKFVKKGKIDTEMLPPELLEMFAMRIPNSSQSLQSVVEVAGFFPVNTDLIIATRDFIARMGQDFDVDKMYIYKTATEFVEGKDNKKAYFKRTEDVKESIMNDIIDIMKSVHKNPNAFKKVNTPLGMWELQDIADDIEKINSNKNKIFSGFSEDYQTNKFIQATQAKSAVGIYAALSIFNATAQEQGLVLTEGGKERLPVEVKFGSKVSHGEMSDKNTLSGKTTKSVVIEGTLSSSLDNEKLQILDKLNMNKDTFSVVSLLEMLGFEEEIFYFITQESINKYFDIANTAESTGEFLDAGQVFGKLVEEYTKKDPSIKDMSEDSMIANADELGYKELRQMLIEGDSYKDYYKHQIGLLMKFLRLQGYADSLGTPLKLLSVDSQGFGKSLLEANEYVDALERLSDSKIDNVGKLFGEFTEEGEFIEPTTIPGFSIYYGLLTNYKLWNQFFPYRKLGYKKYRDLLNSYLRTPKTIGAAFEMSKIAWESMKSFVYSKQNLGLLNNESIEEFRKRAFFGENSLASITLKARTNIKNDFLNALDFSIGKDNLPSLVKYKASAKSNDNELRLYSSFIDLLLNEQDLGVNGQPLLIRGKRYTSRNLYHDLVTSFYITGGNQKANQYGRYISPSYLYSIPFGKELMNFDFVNPSNIGISYELLKDATYIPSVIIQVIQHHPELVGVKVNSKSIKETSEGVTLDEKFLKKYKESHENDPKVFSVYDRKASYGKKVYEPYILVGYKDEGSTPLYKRINAKGTTDFDEYNSNIKYNEVDSSMLAKKPVKLTLDYSHKEVPDEQDNPLNSPDYTFEDIGVVATSNEQDSNKVIKDVLDTISSESTSLYNRQIAGWFRDYVSFNIKKIEVNKADPYNKGSYNYRTKKLTFWLGKYSKVAVENTFLHELIHHITGEGLRKDKKTLKEIEEIRKYVLDKIINSDLKEDYYIIQQFLIEKKIDSLKKEGKKNMSPEIQSLRKEINKISKIIGVVPDVRKFILENKTRFDKTKPIVYGITDAQEFVETILREEEMQRFLNEIPSKNPKKKSVFHEILDKLLSIIRDYIGVREGSVLEDALEASLKFIKIYPENFTTTVDETVEEIPNSVRKINIYAGSGENAELSNFANRPFELKNHSSRLNMIKGDISFKNVEQAFQAAKYTYTGNITENTWQPHMLPGGGFGNEMSKEDQDWNYNILNQIINSNSASEAKKLGRNFRHFNSQVWDRDSSRLMKELLLESFKQNRDALNKLLFTGNAILTHTQDKGKWGSEFPKLLMEVREELTEVPFDINIESNLDNSAIKDGVDFVFEQNPELANSVYEALGFNNDKASFESTGTAAQGSPQQGQQAQQLYSQYLNTIFPDSKVKDIVYHGSNTRFEDFLEDNLNYFGTQEIAKGYGKNIYPVLIEIKKPYYEDGGNLSNQSYEDLYDKLDNSGADGFISNGNNLFVPKESKQIHILGSKQDIEGFKEFVNKKDTDFDIGLPTVEETLKKFNEIDKDGVKKRLRVQTDGSNTNYKAILKRVIDINQGQDLYKASVIKTLVNNKEFWTISLEKKNNLLTFEDRYNAITDDIVQKYIKNCR